MTGGGEDDSLTVPADVEKPLPYIDGHLSAIDALHQGCYEEWVEKMPDEYMDKVDSILSDDSSGVRGRREIEEKLEELEERNGSVVYEGSMGSILARCTDEIRALKWVRVEVDDL